MRIYFLISLLTCWLGTCSVQAQQAQLLFPLQNGNNPTVTLTKLQPLVLPADSVKQLPSNRYLPVNFYSTHLGAACKMELKLEKQTKLPLRIRLGSKDQVDYLEGKKNYHR